MAAPPDWGRPRGLGGDDFPGVRADKRGPADACLKGRFPVRASVAYSAVARRDARLRDAGRPMSSRVDSRSSATVSAVRRSVPDAAISEPDDHTVMDSGGAVRSIQ